MKEFTYVIKEELGLHARPAGLLVKEAKKFQSATTLAAKGKTAAAGKLIAIMSMGVKQGDHVEKDQALIIIEAMKMETAITARTAGTVKSVRVKEGQPVKAKELLMELE